MDITIIDIIRITVVLVGIVIGRIPCHIGHVGLRASRRSSIYLVDYDGELSDNGRDKQRTRYILG